eukprot:341621-Chlamydomonas_euryale.AAC.3
MTVPPSKVGFGRHGRKVDACRCGRHERKVDACRCGRHERKVDVSVGGVGGKAVCAGVGGVGVACCPCCCCGIGKCPRHGCLRGEGEGSQASGQGRTWVGVVGWLAVGAARHMRIGLGKAGRKLNPQHPIPPKRTLHPCLTSLSAQS